MQKHIHIIMKLKQHYIEDDNIIDIKHLKVFEFRLL